jgi:hypothetical protein
LRRYHDVSRAPLRLYTLEQLGVFVLSLLTTLVQIQSDGIRGVPEINVAGGNGLLQPGSSA